MIVGGHYEEWAGLLRRYGLDPVDAVLPFIEAELDVTACRAVDPASYPIVTRPMDPASSARRILGILLDFGWTMPATANGDPDHVDA